MALWFECKIRFDKMMDNGSVKRVTEPYLVTLSASLKPKLVSSKKYARSYPAISAYRQSKRQTSPRYSPTQPPTNGGS